MSSEGKKAAYNADYAATVEYPDSAAGNCATDSYATRAQIEIIKSMIEP